MRILEYVMAELWLGEMSVFFTTFILFLWSIQDALDNGYKGPFPRK